MPVTAPLDVWDVNDVAPLTVTFKVGATPTDPTTVTLRVKKPTGTTVVYTYAAAQVVKDSTGVFHYNLALTEAGDWDYQWEGTGAVQVTEPGNLYVRPSEVTAPALASYALTTIHRARLHVLRSATDDSDDDKLALYINWASDAIIAYTATQLLREIPAVDNVARTLSLGTDGTTSLAPYDLRVADTVTIGYPSGTTQTLAAPSYRLRPRNTTPEGTYLSLEILPTSTAFDTWSWADGAAEITITGDWGMSPVPAKVEGACLVMVDDIFKNPTGFSSVNLGPFSATEPLEFSSTTPIGSVPPAARRLLDFLRRSRTLGSISFAPRHNYVGLPRL